MTIDNYINIQMKILSSVGKEYEVYMSKENYQNARNQVKHFIQEGGSIIHQNDTSLFAEYCTRIFQKYLPKNI